MHAVFRTCLYHRPCNQKIGVDHDFIARMQPVFSLWGYFQRGQVRRQSELLTRISKFHGDSVVINSDNDSVKLLLLNESFIIIEVSHTDEHALASVAFR